MHGFRRRLAFLVMFTAAVLAIAQAAHANDFEDHGGQGNRGSVKVDGDDIDDLPANHPHVICALRVVVDHGFGAPFDIDFDADAPTTRPGNDQRLLIVHVPDGDNISGLIDLRAFIGGIVPNPQQGFHIFITVHLPGGDKHKVIWVLKDCPTSTSSTVASGGTTTTTSKHHATTTTTVEGTTSTTATTVAGGAVNNATATTSTVPTQVLGENFTKNPAAPAAADATSLATTGMPFSPAIAVGLVGFGLLALGGARHISGRRLEVSMRRVNDESQQRFKL